MKQKGQALVEFIVILPLLILIVMGVSDMGNIIYKKYQLENDLDYIADLYNRGKQTEIDTYVKNNNLTIEYDKNINQMTILLKKKITIVTPGLNNVLKNPYSIEVKRVIYDE